MRNNSSCSLSTYQCQCVSELKTSFQPNKITTFGLPYNLHHHVDNKGIPYSFKLWVATPREIQDVLHCYHQQSYLDNWFLCSLCSYVHWRMELPPHKIQWCTWLPPTQAKPQDTGISLSSKNLLKNSSMLTKLCSTGVDIQDLDSCTRVGRPHVQTFFKTLL